MDLALTVKFIKQELVYRYAGSILGSLWAFIFPLINILIFVLIFSKLIGAKINLPDYLVQTEYTYSIYLVSGILGWNAFSATLNGVANVFRDKAGIINKIHVPLLHLPLYILMTESIIYLISLSIFIVFLIVIDFPLSAHWLWIPILLVIQQAFAYSVGMFCAILSVFVRDIRQFVAILLQLWFWLTPIVYVIDILPEAYKSLFYFNPAYPFINSYQNIILYMKEPDFYGLGWLCSVVLGLLLINKKMMSLLERDIRDLI